MEVVLSPGGFGDDVPGAPFQNEEIREWSHVDRLTGMLERARVETGRWRTLNDGAARSYGKVIDSRERNSADGSVVQRARRQVEVFQSEGPGRSVQVVRASQWSSSRVTDSSTTGPLGRTSLAQNKNDRTTLDGLLASSRPNKSSPSSSLCRDEAISERLSTLLGSFASHASSSTVPLRRIDSKYASRAPISQKISKKSNSNEDLIVHTDVHGVSHPTATNSSRHSNGRSYRELKIKSNVAQRIYDCRENSSDDARRKKIHEINVEREESMDYDEISRYGENRGEVDDSEIAMSNDEPRSTTSKAAIQLFPSNRANKTVVNLINHSDNCPEETADNQDVKRGTTLSWLLPGSVVAEEATVPNLEVTTTATTTATSPRRESRPELSAMGNLPVRSVKRVGFCKTEIHFAADSGKVNIVETDGKPPPTNKFRRRRKNSITGSSTGKTAAIDKVAKVETKDSLDERTAEDNGARPDPNLHRGHTTTVNLGTDFSPRNELINRGFTDGRRPSAVETHRDRNFPETLQACSQGILLRLENRIYDRLETYSSEILPDSGVSNTPKVFTAIDVQQTALKSARLVMDLTRVSHSGRVSKIIVDNDVSRNWPTNLHLPDDQRSANDEPSPVEPRLRSAIETEQGFGHYLDLQADNEVQCIMLGSTSSNNRTQINDQALELSSPSTAKEPDNSHENNDIPRIENGASKDSIGESSVNDKICSTRSASRNIDDPVHEDSKDVCDVVCTDADNNQVFLKVVKIHEPTIARVESDDLRKKMRPSKKVAANVKTEPRSKKCSAPGARRSELHKEHTYVNVFTGSKRTPIYENYKIVDPIPIADNKIVAISGADIDSVKEKNVHAAEGKSQISQSSSCAVFKAVEVDDGKLERVNDVVAASVDGKLSDGKELDRHRENLSQGVRKKVRNKTKDSKTSRKAGFSGHATTQSATSSGGRSGKHPDNNSTPRSSVSSHDRSGRVNAVNTVACGNNSSTFKSMRNAASPKTTTNKSDPPIKQKPVEVVYQTAVYNMKNEKLKKTVKAKESKGPRYLNELICGVKMKRPSDSKNSKTSSGTQHAVKNKSALQPVKHWK